MTMKFNEFIRVAHYLNKAFKITPLLFGSLGLEQRLATGLAADDIDVLVPCLLMEEKWDNLVEKMKELGYSLISLEEHGFYKHPYKLAFAGLEDLTPFASVQLEDIPVMHCEDTSYMLLSLAQYLLVYTASSKDSYRRDKNNNKDFDKIEKIKQQMDGTTER